ncbi:MAG: outer membrane protein assembly factor BamE [Parvularculaceae bacterium]|jgi:outer membrane protein assembly factor BamE (lipoprotein component of BamABCDE complex)|nr:outer membrane protein assembly factor BamE [Parvularculaceae bacterium]
MVRSVIALSLAAAALSASGCVSVRSSHGYILERGETELTGRVGLDTKDSIIAKYGEPSMVGTFDPNAWYYLASFDQSRAFFRPRVKDRAVVAFKFDETGLVKSVDTLTVDEGIAVKMASRETPTRGKELSVWEQLLGNVGQLPAGALGGDQQVPGQ